MMAGHPFLLQLPFERRIGGYSADWGRPERCTPVFHVSFVVVAEVDELSPRSRHRIKLANRVTLCRLTCPGGHFDLSLSLRLQGGENSCGKRVSL